VYLGSLGSAWVVWRVIPPQLQLVWAEVEGVAEGAEQLHEEVQAEAEDEEAYEAEAHEGHVQLTIQNPSPSLIEGRRVGWAGVAELGGGD
jgi:hypothetical protein